MNEAIPVVMLRKVTQQLPFYLPMAWSAVALGASLICARVASRAWKDAVALDQEERSTAQRLLSPLASRMAPRTEIEVRALRNLLQRAGLRDEQAMRRFTFFRAASFMAGVGAATVALLSDLPFLQLSAGVLGSLYASLKIPDFWLDGQIKARQTRLARALPAVIDLMVLCLDVGLSVEAAFERVSSEMRSMEPLMAEEAQVMVGEMGAGLTFPQAFKRMADRIGLEELITMSRLISQASAMGASITQALRDYSETSFTKRMLSLEEQAGRISAWLVMPLTLCMLPASILALIGPAIVLARQASK